MSGKRVRNRNRWQDIRLAVFRRDGYTCRYCSWHADSEIEKQSLTVDHIIPVSKGGRSNMRNLVTACQNCNRKKGARVYRHILKTMAARKTIQ